MQDVSGIEGAGPIWHDAMLAAALTRPMRAFTRPPGITEVTICAPTALLPGPACPSPVRERFVAGTEPTAIETYYRYGPNGELRIDPPLEARQWARDAGLALVSDTTVPAAREEIVRIVTPAPGTLVYRAPELPAQRLLIRASAVPGVTRIVIEIDGATAASSDGDEAEVEWTLEPGAHEVRAHAWIGELRYTTSASFEVR
jgi:hypothetical protein